MRLLLQTLLLTLCLAAPTSAAADDAAQLTKLRAEMLKYLSSNDKDRFEQVTEQLKDASREAGNERLFYEAWANQAIYEATRQYYTQAYAIVDDIEKHAREQHSFFGEYTALHARAVTTLQKQSYDDAERQFQQAVSFRHKHFPQESAAEDIQELMKIANHRKDAKAGMMYAKQILAEPNVAPIHRGRALYRLSQIAFNRSDSVMFDHLYMQMDSLQDKTGIGTCEPVVEVNYHILHGNYDEALRLCDQLRPADRAERLALIYHKMGDDRRAYEQMVRFKRINDSIVLVSHGNVVASCYVQMNNERMKLEQQLLQRQNDQLRHRFYYTLAAALVIILGLLVYQRQRRVKSLKQDNARLDKARRKAEHALDVKNEFITNITNELREPLNPISGFSDILGTADYELQPAERELMSKHIQSSSQLLLKLIDEMAEYSFYESKKELPMTSTYSPNLLCRHMVDAMEARCQEGVVMRFESTMPDDVKCSTNGAAVETLLRHLLDNAVRYTKQGTITLGCQLQGDHVVVSVTDTGVGIPKEQQAHVFDMFTTISDEAQLNGMGLSICQSIVRLLKGRIWLDTTYDQGTRFVVELPADEVKE